MRAIAVHEDVVVAIGAIWKTTCTAVRAGDEAFLIDSPILPDELEALPVPGYCSLGERELELHPADGHTSDGTAIWIPWARVLVCGDYLSPGAIPELSPSSSVEGYLATLRRLEPLVEQAATVVPGHGEPLDGVRAAAILREDVAYVEGLAGSDPASAALPLARRDGGNRKLHEYNLSLLG
jgi:glyoxylase-like metal-dependent hydrolase (beta-lactamase superfamily II)